MAMTPYLTNKAIFFAMQSRFVIGFFKYQSRVLLGGIELPIVAVINH